MLPPYFGDPKLASDVSKPFGYAFFAASGNLICSPPDSTMNLASTVQLRRRQQSAQSVQLRTSICWQLHGCMHSQVPSSAALPQRP